MSTPSFTYLHILYPAIILAGAALIVLLIEAFRPEKFLGIPSSIAAAIIAIYSFASAASWCGVHWGESLGDFSGMIIFDPYTQCLTIIFGLGGILSVLLSVRSVERAGSGVGEYYCLLLFAGSGAYLMAAANHLIMVFLGLEILSVAIYPLAGFLRGNPRSNEASLKYFLLGAF